MNSFYKMIAGAMITVILCLGIEKNGKEYVLLLSVCACCMILGTLTSFLQPVLEFFEKVETIGKLNSESVQIMLKSLGVGLLTEIASVICQDAGNNSLGRSVQLFGTVVILWISIPLFEQILDILQSVLSNA